MGDFDWFVKLLPQGTAVAAVVAVTTMILLKYIPALIKEFRDTVNGIVSMHAESLRYERELFRSEMKELRTAFTDGIKDMTEVFSQTSSGISSRLDILAEGQRHMQTEVNELRNRLEA